MRRGLSVAKTAVVGVALFLLLGGPTPGSVGGCSEEGATADAEAFCRDKQAWVCARGRARAELTPEEEQNCINAVMMMCDGASWPADCQPPPTTIQTRACINALSSRDLLSVPTPDIVECQTTTLCGTAPVRTRSDAGTAMTDAGVVSDGGGM